VGEHFWLRWRGCCMATLSAPLSFGHNAPVEYKRASLYSIFSRPPLVTGEGI